MGEVCAVETVAVLHAAWEHRLVKIINAKGPLAFTDFMQLILYDANMGYYRSGPMRIGCAGDFTTAAEIADFGVVVAKQVAQILHKLSDHAVLVEFGPGSGNLCVECLLELQRLGCLPAHYYMVECNMAWRKQQRDLLALKLPEQVFQLIRWVDSMPEDEHNVVVLANEVVDALPVERVGYFGGQWRRGVLEVVDGKLELGFSADLPRILRDVIIDLSLPCIEGYTTEINMELADWLLDILANIEKGACLVFDYGYPGHEYYHPDRGMGTLRTFFRHTAGDDPLSNLGSQDITAHVDFSALVRGVEAAGMDLVGFTTQGWFLINSGILQQAVGGGDILGDLSRSTRIKQLVMPYGMGEVFKVAAFAKGVALTQLCGFTQGDQRARLSMGG